MLVSLCSLSYFSLHLQLLWRDHRCGPLDGKKLCLKLDPSSSGNDMTTTNSGLFVPLVCVLHCLYIFGFFYCYIFKVKTNIDCGNFTDLGGLTYLTDFFRIIIETSHYRQLILPCISNCYLAIYEINLDAFCLIDVAISGWS